MTQYKKKLIEVALPLEAINRESAREKSIRHGHPSTLHLWWARRPLAACRAVLFSSLVDDPSAHPDRFPAEEDQEQERQRLFRIIEDLVKWENAADEQVLAAARAEIMRSTNGKPPAVLDPFCGGGSIPLEAQRLGLEAHATDLNPVAVLIAKALIEIPPKFAGLPPVNPDSQAKLDNSGWSGVQGLAEDVRYYGNWMRRQAESRIGHMYPTVTLPEAQGGGEASVIAWLWARTVKCPNPACGADMPLVRAFELSRKPGARAWVEPVVLRDSGTVRFEVKTGEGVAPQGTVDRRGAKCLVCGEHTDLDYIRDQGVVGRLGSRLMAIAAVGPRGRIYFDPLPEHERQAQVPIDDSAPDTSLPQQGLGFRVQRYGLTHHRDLFSPRQLVSMGAFCELVREVRKVVATDAAGARSAGSAGGEDWPESYADAVSLYLAFTLDRMLDLNNALCMWRPDAAKQHVGHLFARQAIPMCWDWAEANPLGPSAGGWEKTAGFVPKVLEELVASGVAGTCQQLAASASVAEHSQDMVSTDPPYYDNIGYADLSDFFYVWLRQSLAGSFSDILSTLLTPKQQELIADPDRQGGADQARAFFEKGMGEVFEAARQHVNGEYPMTVYYAFKQAETSGARGVASTGWETMLVGLLRAGFALTGTWPMRSELGNRTRSIDSNALATSIVLVCRPRAALASPATRKEFIAALRAELPDALKRLQRGNIAPVDLAQASIGPGMAVFSRYSKVVEADGSQMTVRTALALINQALDEILTEQEGEFDPDTRWAIAWFEQFGMQQGEFGAAETLCTAKNCSVSSMVVDGFLDAKGGKVRLLHREELDEDWSPGTDRHLTVWEMTQHLLRRLDNGEAAAAALARQLGSYAEVARDLAYRLYLICERKKWAQEAFAYNALAVAWPEIQQLAAAEPVTDSPSQTSFEV